MCEIINQHYVIEYNQNYGKIFCKCPFQPLNCTFSQNLALCKSKDNKNKTFISDVSMGTLVKLNFRPFCILYLLLPFQIITPLSIFAVDFGQNII